MAQVTQLYRHFDADGKLLYVGISLSTVARLGQHRNDSHWFSAIKRVEIEHHPDEISARYAERVAIEKETPLYNLDRPHERLQYTPMPVPMSRGRPQKRLSARFVETVRAPGKYCDGNGLNLVVGPTGARRWVFIFHISGVRKEMGLGSVRHASLKRARLMVEAAHAVLRKGRNPFECRTEIIKAGYE